MSKIQNLIWKIKQLEYEIENIGKRLPQYSYILKLNNITIEESFIILENYVKNHVKVLNPQRQMLLLIEGIKEELLIKE